MLNADIERIKAKAPVFVSRLWIEGDLIVYPGQDGKFRWALAFEREPEPSEGYEVRHHAIMAGRRQLAKNLEVLI